MGELKYELVDVDQLIPYVNNARTHSPEQVTKLASAIKEFGFINPVITDGEHGILAGHGRIAAAKQLGLKQVPCVSAAYLTEAQKKAYILADNRLSLDAGWDDELLKIEIEALESEGFDIGLTGFDEKELADLFGTNDKDTEDDDFDVNAALDAAAFVKSGDLWLLGDHRLLCGDSTNPKDVATLMNGQKANVCITDPPYNCAYKGGTGMTIMNDKWSDGEAFYHFLLDAFTNAYNSLVDGGAFYAFHSDAEKCNFFNASVDAGFHYSTTCIWVKNALVIGRMDYQMRHEPVLYAFKDTAKHKFYGDRKQTTVWEFDKPSKSKFHPTQKPLPLIAYPMQNSCQENGIVLDLFGGSGSTMMAAAQLNRKAYLMELDPKYASAIVRRFVASYGTDDVRVIRDGEELPCSEVYIPTDEELEFKESSVTDKQKGSRSA